MTTEELRKYFNIEFGKHGIETPWPETFEVDYETYYNVCQTIFENAIHFKFEKSRYSEVTVILGPNHGILFKGVELLIKK